MRSHKWIDQRSLALDRLIADKLAARPDLLQYVTRTLERWIGQRQPCPPAILLEWQKTLRERSLAETLDLLRSDTEHACRLRQSSPFCGILSPEERLSVLREYEKTRT